MTDLHAVDVFTPSDFPAHTYVARDDENLESRLQEALATPGEIISVSGPSKSGKTVLIEKVVGPDNLITVTGAAIASGDDLWDLTLDWMDTPTEVAESSSTGTSAGTSGAIEAAGGIPLIAQGGASAGVSAESRTQDGTTQTRSRRGLAQVAEEVGHSDFVLFVDDYHYMERAIQENVARQMKDAASRGVKICTASVPHRSDDVVRSNPELRGRVRAIDQSYWSVGDLKRIGTLGFSALGIQVDDAMIEMLAVESSGSPQLMQSLCLQVCFLKGVDDLDGGSIALTEEETAKLLAEASTRTDFRSLVRNMYSGPKSRGTERKTHRFTDGTSGDVYRATLLAIKQDPPRLSFDYDEILSRVQAVCVGEAPRQQSVQQACYQLGEIAKRMYPNEVVIEWDSDDDLLDIADPYLLFYLRHSGQLERLGEAVTGDT